ncbi:Large ribosomal subunit protein uL29 [Candidatus Magnetomoraceae bacterium gMMP-15]
MKASEIRNLSLDEMERKSKDLAEELFRLRFQHVTNQLENTARLRQARHDVARIKTIIKQRHKLENHL